MSNSLYVGTIWNSDFPAPHYFDGRLLLAGDLKAEQKAVMTHQAWLGKSSGYGVIEGLVVTQLDDIQILITPGIGLNREGQAISLSSTFKFPLTIQVTETKPLDDAGLFATCKIPDTGTTSTSSIPAGIYLLTAIPASRFDGKVPMKTAAGGMTTSTPGIGSQWEVEGVQLKIIPIPLTNEPGGTPMNENHRRNLVAHWCYGTVVLQVMGIDPFNFSDVYTHLDPQTPAVLPDFTTCDLPLAVFYWDGKALSFVDMWSARRRIIHPDALEGTQPAIYKSAWRAIVSDKHEAENQARFLQFQDHLAGLVARASASGSKHLELGTVKGADFFHFLPPTGFLPVAPAPTRDLLCADLFSKGFFDEVKNAVTTAAQWVSSEFTNIPRTILNFLHIGVSNHPDVLDIKSQIAGLQSQLGDVQNRLNAISTPVGDLPGQVAELEQRIEAISTTTAGEQTGTISDASQATTKRTATTPEQAVLITFEEQLRRRVCETLGNRPDANSGAGGFILQQFFMNVPLRLNLIRSDRIDGLLHKSWYEDAIDLTTLLSPPSTLGIGNDQIPGSPLIDIYLVEENVNDPTSQLYIIFHKISPMHVLLDPSQQISINAPGSGGGVQQT